jgi:NPCBM/NEW2 domain
MILCPLLAAVLIVAETPPTFDVYTGDCTTVTGPLVKLGFDWSAALGSVKPSSVAAGKLVSLRRAGAVLPPHPLGEHLVMAGGDRLAGTVSGLRDERLKMRVAGSELTVPLTQVSVIWFTAPEREEDAEMFLRRLAGQQRTRDLVLLRNGDRVEGTLNEIDAKGVRIDVQNKEVLVERAKIAAIALNSDLVQHMQPKGPYGHLVLADGTRLALASAQSDGKTLSGKTLFGAALPVPLEQVIALDMRQAAAVYLSDLKPKSYEHTPYLSVRWPYLNDLSVSGRPLRLAGSTYDKGLGLHSQSRLTYELAGAYRWFEASVGLDAHIGREGSVRVAVLVDGKPVTASEDGELTGRDPPRRIRVAVNGAQELTLVVEFGRRGDVGDHVNWVDARLLK